PLVADQGPGKVGAVLGQDLLLDVTARRVLAVADDRQPRLGGGNGCAGDHLAVVLARRVARRDLDAPGLDAGLADPVLDLVQVELGDLLRRAHAPVIRNADVLQVEAGGTDDLHPGLARYLGEQLGIAAEVDRTRV